MLGYQTSEELPHVSYILKRNPICRSFFFKKPFALSAGFNPGGSRHSLRVGKIFLLLGAAPGFNSPGFSGAWIFFFGGGDTVLGDGGQHALGTLRWVRKIASCPTSFRPWPSSQVVECLRVAFSLRRGLEAVFAFCSSFHWGLERFFKPGV